MALPIAGIIFGGVKSWLLARVLKAASEEFIHAMLDKLAAEYLPEIISWFRVRAEKTPGKFDDATVDIAEKALKDLLEG
jgi:hypothetical protein